MLSQAEGHRSQEGTRPQNQTTLNTACRTSTPRKSSIDDSRVRRRTPSVDMDTRTHSMQSLSGVSTTSSVPSYMRPKGESCSCRRHTPERDIHEVENALLNAYQYIRCTKKISKPA
ncbi:hypothetical protein Hamer_G024176 [Homarus americanus]|uniref:Uncharacterized protein n=1 Tax=Homarus americanus TaxID=6706 RepID=A0A8J5K296_HOMAM|nr:hypothetical protein Hamer_G024176 [Homarus americanus]